MKTVVKTRPVKEYVLFSELTPLNIIGFQTQAGPKYRGFVRSEKYLIDCCYSKSTTFELVSVNSIHTGNFYNAELDWNSVLDNLKSFEKVFVFDTTRELLKWLSEAEE